MENLESVMRRIKKLLAIAEDSRGDPNECAAAARMAESIMRKFQIEHADVISVELQREDALSSVDIGATMDMERRAKEASGWAGILAVPVAELFDAQARYAYTPEKGRTIRFSGYKTDVQMCRFTYEFIVQNMAAASRAYLKEHAVARREAESFRRGYISACCASLKALKREKDAELQQASSSRAMVLSKASAVAAHFGSANYRSRVIRTSSAQAYATGQDAGSKLQVGSRGVGVDTRDAPRLG